MDQTLLYCLLIGIGLVFVFVAIKFAVRWIVRLAIVALILFLVFGGAAWIWRTYSQQTPSTRSTPARRTSTDRQ